jgi:hypothetical protein
MVIIKPDAEKFQLNAIARGHNNIAGLVNLETVEINEIFLQPVRDVGTYEGGQRVVNGIGQQKEAGFASQTLNAASLSNAQRWWLQTEILAGKISGPVTYKAHKYAVPMANGMSAPLIVANAMMSLPPNRSTQRYVDGITDFRYIMNRVVVIEEDQMYASIYVTGGVAAQGSIGTTPAKLTAFDTNGNSNGITPDHSDDDLTVIVAGEYEVLVNLSFTGTASAEWIFEIYKNDVATGIRGGPIPTNATPDPTHISFGGGRTINLVANDVLTVYVESDDGGGGDSITVVEGAFSLKSISFV